MTDINPTPTPMLKNQARRIRKRKQKKDIFKPALFILDPSNVKRLCNQNQLVKKTLSHDNFNHRVIIQNTSNPSGKVQILQAIIKQVEPHILVPLEINCVNNNIEFLCCHCGPALIKLCDDELLLNFMFKDQMIKLPITIKTCVHRQEDKKLNTWTVLKTMLTNKITSTEPITMNLEKFDKIPGMQKLLYLELSNPLHVAYVLNKCKHVQPKVLNLSDNNIQTLEGWKQMYPLESVDLSYNQINSFEDLGILLKIDLKKINLSYNPIQNKFSSDQEFKSKIKELFPNAEIVESKPKPNQNTNENEYKNPNTLKSFVESESASYFIDQFMEHYFNFYDNSKKRRYLQDMYHSDAIFTLTSTIVNKSGETICPGSQRYKHHAHNLLDLKSRTDYVTGPSEIIRKLCYLPSTEHDHYTFRVDVLRYVENESAMFVINGMFREAPASDSPYYFFSRNFMLIAGEYGEFKIINDLLFVTNDKPKIYTQMKPFSRKAFYYKETTDISDKLPLPLAVRKDQKDGTLAIFIETTLLHVEPATYYLEKTQWNLRKALEIFIHDLRFDCVSSDCFMQEEQKTIVFKHLPKLEPGLNREKLGKMLENLKNLRDKKYFIERDSTNKKILCREKFKEIKTMLCKNTGLVRNTSL